MLATHILFYEPIMNELLNISGRAVAVYLFIIVCIRFFGKKELTQLSVVDLVFVLLISNAVQNAMVGPDTSLMGGVVAAGALFASNFVLKKLLYRSPRINHLLQGEPILLAYKGHVKDRNLAKAQISVNELEAAIREHGVERLEKVDLAVLEVDGNISVMSDDFSKKTRHKRVRPKINPM